MVPVGAAQSPKAAIPSAVCALAPDGMPLLRRDSAIDGRPKRAIVPAKRTQESFSGRQPKKPKYDLQLRFCQVVIKEVASSKHREINQYFAHPIDPVFLNIPTYFQLIKKPMDLGTIQTNLDENIYEKAEDFEKDVRLVFSNCYKFFVDNAYLMTCGRLVEELFEEKWQRKAEWVNARQHTSDSSSDEGDEAQESDSDRVHDEEGDIEVANQQGAEGTTSTPFQKPDLPFKLKFKCNGHGHSVTVKREDCILDVKDKIEVDSGISAEGQSLFVNSQKVHDADMLWDLLNVVSYSVELRIDLPKLVKFSVKTPPGDSVEMQLAHTTTVARVKSMLQEKVGIPTGQQLLVKENIVLLDNEALHAFDIDNGDSLELHVRIQEGGCGCGQNSNVQGETRAGERNTEQDNGHEMDEQTEDLADTKA